MSLGAPLNIMQSNTKLPQTVALKQPWLWINTTYYKNIHFTKIGLTAGLSHITLYMCTYQTSNSVAPHVNVQLQCASFYKTV